MSHARILTSLSDLELLVPAWRRLLARASHPEPVLTPLWLLAWWRQFGEADRRELRVVAVEDGGELTGLVPLSRRAASHRRAIPVRRLELLGSGEPEADEIGSDYLGGLALPGSEEDVARAVAAAIQSRALGEWDELQMPAMSAEDPLVPRLADALGERGAAATLIPGPECPYIPLPATWDEYLRALGSSRRYVVTRSLRELDKWTGPGGWEVRTAQTAGELAEGKRVLSTLHGERWSSVGRSGVFDSRRFEAFHDDVMPRMLAGEDGASLELIWLLAKGEPIAAVYNIVYGNKVYFYQSGRRVDVPKAIRPGIALHAMAIRRSIEAGRREYDFLAGASRYKRDLALAFRPLVTLRAVAPGLRARAVEAARLFAEEAIVRVRSARDRINRRPDGQVNGVAAPAAAAASQENAQE
jgi:CelD/BcsL family acetyltransferase involved in cellulose biosynthesis